MGPAYFRRSSEARAPQAGQVGRKTVPGRRHLGRRIGGVGSPPRKARQGRTAGEPQSSARRHSDGRASVVGRAEHHRCVVCSTADPNSLVWASSLVRCPQQQTTTPSPAVPRQQPPQFSACPAFFSASRLRPGFPSICEFPDHFSTWVSFL